MNLPSVVVLVVVVPDVVLVRLVAGVVGVVASVGFREVSGPVGVAVIAEPVPW